MLDDCLEVHQTNTEVKYRYLINPLLLRTTGSLIHQATSKQVVIACLMEPNVLLLFYYCLAFCSFFQKALNALIGEGFVS